VNTMAKYEKKKWRCSQCEEFIEFNTAFFNEVKERSHKEWNDMNNLEKADWREKLQADGFYPTILADSGQAHLCDVKSLREEVEALKLENKRLSQRIEKLEHQLQEIREAYKLY
jgi:hypothetical protein